MSLADRKAYRSPNFKLLQRRVVVYQQWALWSGWSHVQPHAWHSFEAAGAVSSEFSAVFGDVGRSLRYAVRKGVCSAKTPTTPRG